MVGMIIKAFRTTTRPGSPSCPSEASYLFHDTNERAGDFGVWRLWNELSNAHPSFEFLHGHGLGILAPSRVVPEGLVPLLWSGPQRKAAIRAAYVRLGKGVLAQHELYAARARIAAHDHEQQAASRAIAAAHASIAAAQAETAEAFAAQSTAVESASASAALAAAAIAERARFQTLAARAEQARDAAILEATARVAEDPPVAGMTPEDQARLDAALAERDMVLNSTFWRLSSPLRHLAEAVPVRLRRSLGRLVRLRSGTGAGHQVQVPAQSDPPPQTEYDRWVEQYDTLTADDRALIRTHIDALRSRPKISVIMPAYDTPKSLLRQAIASVQAQLYPDWELCIADDASPSGDVVRILQEAASTDPRIKWMRRESNGHIAAASNSALALATGDFVALMDHDDVLPEHALYEIAAELDAHPDTDLIYSDEDRIDNDGRRFNPYFKPDWNIDLLLGHNMVCHLGVYRRSLLEGIGGFQRARSMAARTMIWSWQRCSHRCGPHPPYTGNPVPLAACIGCIIVLATATGSLR